VIEIAAASRGGREINRRERRISVFLVVMLAMAVSVPMAVAVAMTVRVAVSVAVLVVRGDSDGYGRVSSIDQTDRRHGRCAR
jgi:hypothetical protein